MSAREWRAWPLEVSGADAEDLEMEIASRWGIPDDVTLEVLVTLHLAAEPRIIAEIEHYLEEHEAI